MRPKMKELIHELYSSEYDGFLFHMRLKSVNVLTITLNSSDDGKIKQILLYLPSSPMDFN